MCIYSFRVCVFVRVCANFAYILTQRGERSYQLQNDTVGQTNVQLMGIIFNKGDFFIKKEEIHSSLEDGLLQI